MNPIWNTVADLLADSLARGFRSGALHILKCESLDAMEDELRLSLEDEAAPLLEEAKRRLSLQPEVDSKPRTFPLPPPARPDPDVPPTDSGTLHNNPPSPDLDANSDGAEPRELTVGPGTPPGPARPHSRRRLVVTKATAMPPRANQRHIPEDDSLHVVREFERNADSPRFVIDVNHIRGSDGFGCDLVSVASESVCREAEIDGELDERHILRFIEVKGRRSARVHPSRREPRTECGKVSGALLRVPGDFHRRPRPIFGGHPGESDALRCETAGHRV